MSADLDGHAAGDFGHGGEDGKRVVGELDGFVGEGDAVGI